VHDGRRVDEDVESAERARDPLRQLPRGTGIAEVGCEAIGPAASGPDLVPEGLGAFS